MPPRPLSTRLLLATLISVGVPFVVFVYLMLGVVSTDLTADAAEVYLRNKARDVADKIDLSLHERRLDLKLWVREPTAVDALKNPGDASAVNRLTTALNTLLEVKDVYDLLAVFDLSGTPVAWSTVQASGAPISKENEARRRGADVSSTAWFREAADGAEAPIDWHRDSLIVKDVSFPSKEPSDYSVGYAAPIRDPETGVVLGVWYSLLAWQSIQDLLDRVQQEARNTESNERFTSAYAFIWKEDAGTILGHQDRSLYGSYVAGPPVNLPELAQAVRDRPNGIHTYDYLGKSKRAAFAQTFDRARGGFGWIVGVGVKDEQVFAPARIVGNIVFFASLAAVLGLLVSILYVSRTVTRPLGALAHEANRIAQGELDARAVPSGPRETVMLAQAFNRMAEDVSTSRERLVRAEKEMAWREMARQISHEIKNPLSALKSSIQLLDRAWRDKSPEFDTILQRSVAIVDRQIESLRRIAADFRAFAGAPVRRRESIDLAALLEQCAALFDASAATKQVRVERSLDTARVSGDPEELQRAVVNLMENALEAAPAGTAVTLTLRASGGQARVCVHDQGSGVPEALRAKLFTPYFSTRTHGTGLGLSIVRRIAVDHGGAAYLDVNRADGTTMVIDLPVETPGARDESPPAAGAPSADAAKNEPPRRAAP